MSRRCRMGRKRLSRRRFWGWGTSRPATNQPSCSFQNLLTAGIVFFERFLNQFHFQRNRSNGRISHHLRTFRWLPENLPRFRISWSGLAFPHAGDPCTSRILSWGKVGSHSLDFLLYFKKSNANLCSIEKSKLAPSLSHIDIDWVMFASCTHSVTWFARISTIFTFWWRGQLSWDWIQLTWPSQHPLIYIWCEDVVT